MGLSKTTHLYKILKPSMRVFCAKLDSAASRTASHASIKSTTQARISVEEQKGLMHLRSIVSSIGYVLLDLRAVLGIIHELIIQRHASCELSAKRTLATILWTGLFLRSSCTTILWILIEHIAH